MVSAAPLAYSQWVQTSTLPNAAIHGFGTIDATLFVGTEGGIFLTSDNGTTWTPSNNGFAGGIAYAFSTIGSTIFAGADSGIYLSTDMGGSWAKENTGQSDKFVTSFAQGDGNLYAGVGGGVLLSTDGGNDWQTVSTGLPSRRTISLTSNGSYVFAGGVGGVYVSSNNGTSWTLMIKGLANELIFSLLSDGETIYAGSNASVAFSTNNGALWTPDTTGMSFTVASCLAGQGSDIFCGTFVQTGIIYHSSDAGANWQAINDGLPNTIRPIYAVAISGSTLYIGTNGGGVWQRPLSDFGISDVAENAPTHLALTNYPNPFSQASTINFTSQENGKAHIVIVNLLGQQVAQLFDGELDAGAHSFVWDAKDAPAGTYFCVIGMNGTKQQVPMVLSR